MQHSAASHSHALLTCGSVRATDFGKFEQLLFELEEKVVENRRAGLKGLQRNPGFVLSVAKCALEAVRDDVEPFFAEDIEELVDGMEPSKGGFSDVGLHTGGMARNTCWQLYRESLKAVLMYHQPPKEQEILYRLYMTYFEKWLLTSQVNVVRSTHKLASPAVLSACMHMLRSVAAKCAELSEDGHDMSACEASFAWVTRELQGMASGRALFVASSFNLPVGMPAASEFRLPSGKLPDAALAVGEVHGLDAARQRAERNLGTQKVLPVDRLVDFSQILDTFDFTLDNPVSAQLVLRSVETQLFRRAIAGFEHQAAVSTSELGALEEMVDKYRILVQRWRASGDGSTCMQVELQSRELLVVWSAYCISFQAARHEHAHVMKGFGVALDWHDLRHLVLGDKLAVDAALKVAAYLHAYTVPNQAVFSRSCAGSHPTFNLALLFATNSISLMGIWQEEQKAAIARRDDHWQEVQRKQKLAAELRASIASAREYARDLQSRRDREWQKYLYLEYDRQLQSQYSAIQGLESQLRSAEASPPPVIQPLPAHADTDLQWLFFLHMPKLFQVLSRFSFLAQQMLLPSVEACHGEWSKMSESFETDLEAYYNGHQVGNYGSGIMQHKSAPCTVKLVSTGKPPLESNMSDSHVDKLLLPDHGVWHPDSLKPQIGWMGSGCEEADQLDGVKHDGYFNPFTKISCEPIEHKFTEELCLSTVQSSGDTDSVAPTEPQFQTSPLQWAMHVHGSVQSTPRERGNIAVARQDVKPQWLSKPGFLALGSLRSFPLGQMRMLSEMLHLREVPWAQPEVMCIIKQAVYHMGTLVEDSSGPRLLWRTNWQGGGDMLVAISDELESLADELAQTPRDQDSVLLLGELAAFLSSWHTPCVHIARSFAAMTVSSADALEQSIVAAESTAVQNQLQARQCKLLMMALLCYGPCAIGDKHAASAVLKLIVRVKHAHVFFDLGQAEDDELKALHVRCLNVTARHIDSLVSLRAQTHTC